MKSKQVKTEDVLIPLMEDFTKLVEANPQLQLPLVNIIQHRMLAEQTAEIARLSALVPSEPAE